MSSVLRHSPFILRFGAGMLSLHFLSLSITSKKVFLKNFRWFRWSPCHTMFWTSAPRPTKFLENKAISDPKIGKEWCQRTNRAVFTWRKPCREAGKVTYQDRHSIFNNIVRDAIRRGAAENEVHKHQDKLTGAWRQMSTLRRRYEKWCKCDDTEDFTHKQRYEASYQSMVKVLQQNMMCKMFIDNRKS